MWDNTKSIEIKTDLIFHLAKEGIAILLISSDLPEILKLSDRIIIISEGELVKELNKNQATQESIISFATPKKKSIER